MLEDPTGEAGIPVCGRRMIFFFLFSLWRNSSSTPHKTSLQRYSPAFLPLPAVGKQFRQRKGITRAAARRDRVPWRCKEPGAAAERPQSCHERGCRGPRDPTTSCLKMEKEVALAPLGRLYPGCGKKEKEEKGWRQASFRTRGMSGSKEEAAVVINSGNWRSHVQEHLY